LNDAVKKFMRQPDYRNVMSNHSNVQVGEVVKNYRDSSGRRWNTAVDDVGFFVVIKMRDDIEKAREVNREIRQGGLRSFSIGGQALEKRKVENQELGEYNEINKLELHEVTICEKGINPEAKFDILKEDTGMSSIETALNELNTILKEINGDKVHKDGENFAKSIEASKAIRRYETAKEEEKVSAAENMEDELQKIIDGHLLENDELTEEHKKSLEMSPIYLALEDAFNDGHSDNPNNMINKSQTIKQGDTMPDELEQETEVTEMLDTDEEESLEYQDTEAKAEENNPMTGNIPGEAGEEIHDGTPKSKHQQISIGSPGEKGGNVSLTKGLDVSSLDLTPENLEKAYSEFRQEQLEKMAYDNVKKDFETRFTSEMKNQDEVLAKQRYNAKSEVDTLKKQFSDLLDVLKNNQESVIHKQQEEIKELNIPSDEDIAKMNWNEIHETMARLEQVGW
jgi:HK97 family phage prohead protease